MAHLPTILVVDDDATMREVLCVHLEDEGYRLLKAEDGPSALETARRTYPDLILLDVMMPGMDGYEVCRRLRRDPLLAEIPVVMITSLDDRESRLEGLRAGADDFLPKPYDTAELRARVGTITRLNRYRRLHEERAKLEWVVERASEGYLMLDADDRLVYTNATARRLLGIGDDATSDLGGEGDAPPRFVELAARRFRCEPEAGWARWPELSSALYLLRTKSASGVALWLRLEVLDLPSGGEAQRLVRLKDETEAMALGRRLWKLGALVEHRLDAPLSIALGSLEMLAAEERSPEETSRLAQLALRGGRRLEENVRRLARFLDWHDRPWERGLELDRLPDLVNELGTHLGLGPLALAVAGSPGRLPLSGVEVELLLREILDNLRRFHPTGEPRIDLRLAILPPKSGQRFDEEDQTGVSNRARLTLLTDATTLTADELARTWVPYYHRGEEGEETAHSLGASMVGPLVWGVGGAVRVRGDHGSVVAVELTLPLLD